MSDHRHKIKIEQVENILLEIYNLKGIASHLPGEIDFNFRIKTENGDGYVFKISQPQEKESYLIFQQELLQFVEKNGKQDGPRFDC